MLTINKLISADGLTKYEPNDSSSKTPIRKILIKHLRVSTASSESLSSNVVARTYEFDHMYFDDERGIFIQVYREAL